MIPRLFPYVPPAILGGLALYAAVLMWRGRHAPPPDGCGCGPCRDFEAAVRDACLVLAAEVMPGPGPRDGKPLNRAQWRVLRGIEAASRDERAVQP